MASPAGGAIPAGFAISSAREDIDNNKRRSGSEDLPAVFVILKAAKNPALYRFV